MRLEGHPVQPGGRAGVPGPAAPADVRRPPVDVGRDDVRLDLVAVDRLGAVGVADRVEQVEQLARASAAAAEPGEGLHHPGRRVGVLAAVLADAGDVALDVARARGRPASNGGVKSRISPSSRRTRCSSTAVHRLRGPLGIGGAGDHGPGLGERVDPALVVARRARAACRRRSRPGDTSRRPRRAASTAARSGSACRRLGRPGRRRRAPRPASANRRRIGDQEPGDPDALALAPGPDPVHPVVPVAGAHQRQAVRARASSPCSSARTQCSYSVAGLVGDVRQAVDSSSWSGRSGGPVEERHRARRGRPRRRSSST